MCHCYCLHAAHKPAGNAGPTAGKQSSCVSWRADAHVQKLVALAGVGPLREPKVSDHQARVRTLARHQQIVGLDVAEIGVQTAVDVAQRSCYLAPVRHEREGAGRQLPAQRSKRAQCCAGS